MARTAAHNPAGPPVDAEPGGYTVVARRYRPQTFDEVVGQDHVVQGLRNAITLNRVTHAYLFCGTRGVGKTSVARIFAKCLNCVKGPTVNPCLKCDVCQLIALGQDVDVIEIDGASNNGVEAVRELRQNAGLRPSRSRFKIYYIDEVHMLTLSAFNALLKTLEEPPEHVKFFFATTEPNKIPITVLSRCQRYDFAGIEPGQIVETLAEICGREKVEAETDALRAIARRSGGSMRDAQSLLEQLLSAGGRKLTAELVHQVLGIADDESILDLIEAMADHDSAGVLTRLEHASRSGVQPVDVLAGSLEFLRDLMVVSAGADVVMLAASPAQLPRLREIAGRWSLDSVMAALQILAEARARLRGSPHGRLIIELAMVRVARLENLAEIGELVARLAAMEAGLPAPSRPSHSSAKTLPVKKKSAPVEIEDGRAGVPTPSSPSAAPHEPPGPAPKSGPRRGPTPWELPPIQAGWLGFVSRLGPPLSTTLAKLSPVALAEPNQLVLGVAPEYNWAADSCRKADSLSRIETELTGWLGRPTSLRFESADPGEKAAAAPPAHAVGRHDELARDPIVRKVMELFDARLLQTDDGDT